MSRHKKGSKCSTLITTETFKKDRRVYKNCYNTKTPNLMKKRIGLLEENSYSKQDSPSDQDNSDIQNS